MEIQVNLEREEVTSYFRQVMKTTTEDKTWHFIVGFSENQLEEMEDHLKKKLDTREFKDARATYPFIEKSIWHKLKMKPNEAINFDPVSLEQIPKVITAFREKVCDLIGIATYKPKQQTMDEVETEE